VEDEAWLRSRPVPWWRRLRWRFDRSQRFRSHKRRQRRVARRERARQHPRIRRAAWLTLDVIVLAIVIAGAYSYYRTQQTRSRVRSHAAHFDPPPGWTKVATVEEGSQWCIVSCDAPAVTTIYRTTDSPSAACDDARAALAREDRTAAVPAGVGCGWRVPARRVGKDAYDISDAASPQDVERRRLPWTRKVEPLGAGTIVWVEFRSGID